MNKLYYIVVLVGLSLISESFWSTADAQNGDVYRIETTDGNIFIGELLGESAESVVLFTESAGELTIRRESITKMTKVVAARVRNGEYWYENPNATRYFFAPGARGLQKGRGYYQNTWIFLNNVDYGVSNNFSLGVGTVPLFFFGGDTPVWLIPKLSTPALDGRLHLSASAVLGGVAGAGSDILGIFYGAGTYGNADKNLTLGLGYGYSEGSLSSTPVMNISGMFRASRRGYIITENYFFPGTDANGIISAGYRYATENASVDFGLLRPLEDTGSLIGIPWLGITIPFTR